MRTLVDYKTNMECTKERMMPMTHLDYTFEKLKLLLETPVAYFVNKCPEENPDKKRGAVLLVVDRYGNKKHCQIGQVDDYKACLAGAEGLLRQLKENACGTGAFTFYNERSAALYGLPEPANEACLMTGLCFAECISKNDGFKRMEERKNMDLFARIWNNS